MAISRKNKAANKATDPEATDPEATDPEATDPEAFCKEGSALGQRVKAIKYNLTNLGTGVKYYIDKPSEPVCKKEVMWVDSQIAGKTLELF